MAVSGRIELIMIPSPTPPLTHLGTETLAAARVYSTTTQFRGDRPTET